MEKLSFEALEKRQDLSKATFAGGCFWCMEGPFEAMDGVEEAIAGFAGGDVENPSYEQVVSGSTGHREAVRVYYDPNIVTYNQLLQTYWYQIDPTDEGGQFADRGEQYTTAIFYHDDEQKEAASYAIKLLDESQKYNKKIVTKILPVTTFYPAENYHQNFYEKSKLRYETYAKLSGRKDYTKNITNSLNQVFKD